MIFLHIDPSTKNIDLFNKYIEQGKHIFVLFYMEGCGPCNATRPEWSKIQNVLEKKYKNDNFVVADIDQQLLSDIKHLKSQPRGYPTMRFISNKGKISEDYEDSEVKNKDRTVDSFVEWIELKMPKHKGGTNSKTKKMKVAKSKKTRHLRGGKWSLKYKRSINCRHPKGFSQKQHCKYGRKK